MESCSKPKHYTTILNLLILHKTHGVRQNKFYIFTPKQIFCILFYFIKIENMMKFKRYIVEISKCRNHWIKRIYMTLKLKIYVMKICSYVEWIFNGLCVFFLKCLINVIKSSDWEQEWYDVKPTLISYFK